MTDDDQQRERGIAGIEIEENGRAGGDLNAADQGGEVIRERETNRDKAPRAQFVGPEELEDAFRRNTRPTTTRIRSIGRSWRTAASVG